MQDGERHLSDEELLLFSDQELPLRDAAGVRGHIAQCEACRGRLKNLEAASDDFAELHEQDIRAQNSSHALSRGLLLSRLSELSAQTRSTHFFGTSVAQQLAGVSLALLLIGGGWWTIRHTIAQSSHSDLIQTFALPRKTLTPGSIRTVQFADLCGTQSLENDPPVNASLQQAVFNEYGVHSSSKQDYELDYLISPALGGADNIQNLWPQPYSSAWNSRAKDQLESHLHELVCQGKVPLTTAQNDIATDWIAAYKRYFNTDKPEHSAL